MDTRDDMSEAAEVLLVDDSRTFVSLVEAIIDNHPTIRLVHTAADGVEAMAYLRREGPHADARLPDLILLDINMPRKDGFEVLHEIRRDAYLRGLPVIVFTTSSDQGDIDRAYVEGANSFITKPIGVDELEHVLGCFAEFWIRTAQLPTRV